MYTRTHTHIYIWRGNYTKMLPAVFHKSWKQSSNKKKQLYGHLNPISQTIQDKQDMLGSAGEVMMNS